MRSRLLPSASNCETTELRAARPKLTISMKAPTPIAKPTAVSALRPGLRSGTESAIKMASFLGSAMVVHLFLAHHAAIAHVDDAVGGLRHLWIVRDDQDGQARF